MAGRDVQLEALGELRRELEACAAEIRALARRSGAERAARLALAARHIDEAVAELDERLAQWLPDQSSQLRP